MLTPVQTTVSPRGTIADQRFVRPVVGVADVIVGAIGGCRPRRPKEECRQLSQSSFIGHGSGRNCIVGFAVGEHIGVVRKVRLERIGPKRIDRDGVRCRIVGVGPHERGQATAQLCLLFSIKSFVIGSESLIGPTVENEDGFSMQPIGGPVGGDVAAVSPDRADFHAAQRLPDVLASLNFAGIDDDLAFGRDHLVDNRWCFLVDPSADPTENGKRHYQYHNEEQP